MKKKILFIITTLKIGGGAERVTSLLTTALSKKYNIYILTFYESKEKYPFLGKYYSFNEKKPIYQRFLNSLKRPVKISRFIKSISPDIIISSLDYTTIYTVIAKILFRFKNPIVTFNHTNPKGAYKRFSYLNVFIKIFYPSKLVNKVVTISKNVQYILENYYQIQRNKIKVINDGVDLEKIKELANHDIVEYQDLFNDTSLIKFITVGRLHEVKGHKFLIDAFSKVNRQLSNSKLFLIGDGPLKEEIKDKIYKLGLENHVYLLGIKKNPFKYVVRSDIFILPSKAEGFGIALIEALALNIPIISTECVGPKEILDNGKYGLLVKKKDSEDLAKKMILFAINIELREKYRQISSKRVEKYDIKNILNEWLEFLSSF